MGRALCISLLLRISIHVTGEAVKIEGDVTDAADLDRIDEMTRRVNQLL